MDAGDQPVVFVDVKNDQGVPTTPTDGRLLIAAPGATESTVVAWSELSAAPGGAVGRVEYSFPNPVETPGTWKLYWEFTAGVIGAEPFSFRVVRRTVPAPAAI